MHVGWQIGNDSISFMWITTFQLINTVWKQNVLFFSWFCLNQVSSSTVTKQKVEQATGNGEMKKCFEVAYIFHSVLGF